MTHRATFRIVAFVATALGCHEATAPAFTGTRVSPDAVTGAALAALNAAGVIVFPRPAFRVISPEQADSFGVAETAAANITAEAGGFAAFTEDVVAMEERNWTPCGRNYYLASAYPTPAIPDTNTALFYGPHYVVPVCNRSGAPSWWVAVADGRSDVTFDGTWFRGNHISGLLQPLAMQYNSDHGLPESPEEAIMYAYQSTGTRVDQIPDGFFVPPAFAAFAEWHVHLEAAVSLIDSAGTVYSTHDLYVSRAFSRGAPGYTVLQIGLPPTPSWLRYVGSWSQSATPVFDSIQVTPLWPTRFQTVTAKH